MHPEITDAWQKERSGDDEHPRGSVISHMFNLAIPIFSLNKPRLHSQDSHSIGSNHAPHRCLYTYCPHGNSIRTKHLPKSGCARRTLLLPAKFQNCCAVSLRVGGTWQQQRPTVLATNPQVQIRWRLIVSGNNSPARPGPLQVATQAFSQSCTSSCPVWICQLTLRLVRSTIFPALTMHCQSPTNSGTTNCHHHSTSCCTRIG